MGKGNTYEYITDRNNKVRVGERRHKRIQNGETFTWPKGLGKVAGGQDFYIVGVSGRAVPNPVARAGSKAKIPSTIAEVLEFVQRAPAIPVVDLTGDMPPVQAVTKPVVAPVAAPVAGVSKATQVRNIMSAGYRNGKSYETIIAEMMSATGWPRQQARATFKNNMAKAGIPSTFC